MLELRSVPDDELPARRHRMLERTVARRVRTSFENQDEARAGAESTLADSTLRHYDVRDDGEPAGWVAWWRGHDSADIADLELDDPAVAPELLPLLVQLARAEGARFLGLSTIPGEPSRDPLAELDGFVRRATNMALPLDGVIGDPGRLELRPMTQEAFDDYMADSNEQYIAELAAAGMTEEAAREQGERQLAELIPNGLESPGQSFFTAWVGETPVGTLWVSTERPMAFVYDIEVREDQRRKGYGEAIMNAAARWCRDRGHPGLGLNVFGHNPGARALYDKLGYRVTQDYRSIDLDDAG